jgi:hypothetical protein
VTEWAARKGTRPRLFAGARARERWETSPHAPITECTEAHFDAVIASVASDRL